MSSNPGAAGHGRGLQCHGCTIASCGFLLSRISMLECYKGSRGCGVELGDLVGKG